MDLNLEALEKVIWTKVISVANGRSVANVRSVNHSPTLDRRPIGMHASRNLDIFHRLYSNIKS